MRDGQREEGKIPSRANRNHEAIYRRYPQINAIVNAYSVNSSAFIFTVSVLDTRTIPESYIFLRDAVRIPYGVQFQDSSALAAAISPTRPIALLANDGVLVVGKSVLDTFDRLEVLESTAEALINCAPWVRLPDGYGVIEELLPRFSTTKRNPRTMRLDGQVYLYGYNDNWFLVSKRCPAGTRRRGEGYLQRHLGGRWAGGGRGT